MGWLKINKYIVWLYLSYNGLLSEFKVMLELTDNSELPSKTKDKRSMIQKDYIQYSIIINNGLMLIIF